MSPTEPMNSSDPTKRAAANGPLHGVRVLEFAGLGPAPFCGMLLSDLGAQVIRISRPNAPAQPFDAILDRGRVTLTVDLKQSVGVAACRALAGSADVLIEGFRPGVLEKLGLGPDTLLATAAAAPIATVLPSALSHRCPDRAGACPPSRKPRTLSR